MDATGRQPAAGGDIRTTDDHRRGAHRRRDAVRAGRLHPARHQGLSRRRTGLSGAPAVGAPDPGLAPATESLAPHHRTPSFVTAPRAPTMVLPYVLASQLHEVRPGLIFWTIVTFLIVVFVLRAKAWGPILGLVEEREKQITNAIESAKRERAEAEKLLAEQKTAIAEARREAAEMMRKNQAEMERFREELMAKSRKEAEELKAQRPPRDRGPEDRRPSPRCSAMAVDLAIEVAEQAASTSAWTTPSTARWPSSSSTGLPGSGHAPGAAQPAQKRRRGNAPWRFPSASSACPTWASPPSSTRSPRRARRRRTTRSAPSSRTWAWCRCRTSGWTSSPRW